MNKHKLRQCTKCGKSEKDVFLYKDGECGMCKNYSVCEICKKIIHNTKMLPDNICRDCDKDFKNRNEVTQRKNNKSAIIGFVLSVISIFGVGLAGIIGMILGIFAITQINHSQEKGKVWAIAAIVIGFIWGFGVGILRRLFEMNY